MLYENRRRGVGSTYDLPMRLNPNRDLSNRRHISILNSCGGDHIPFWVRDGGELSLAKSVGVISPESLEDFALPARDSTQNLGLQELIKLRISILCRVRIRVRVKDGQRSPILITNASYCVEANNISLTVHQSCGAKTTIKGIEIYQRGVEA